MGRRRSGYIQVSVFDILEEVDDDDLLSECESRGLASLDGIDGEAEIREAYRELRSGRVAEAIAILDRLINPKWSSRDKSLEQFVKTQARLV